MESTIHDQRRQRVASLLGGLGVQALVVNRAVNVTYLTGFTGDSSWLLLLADGQAELVSDGRYSEQIAQECPGLAVSIRPHDRTLVQAVAEALARARLERVGVESDEMTLDLFQTLRQALPEITWTPTRGLVEQLRAIKDADEIAAIRRAIRCAERAFTAVCAMLRPSDSERDIVDALEQAVRRVGGTGTAFAPMAAVGPRSALPHAPPTHQRVAEAGWVLIDWGAKVDGYLSDLTRLVCLPGWNRYPRYTGATLNIDLAGLYAVVREAQRRAIAAMRPGVPCREIDRIARQTIADAGMGEYFTHGLGHSFGLLIHEQPQLRANSDAVLEAGMVLTVEPGVYLPGWGGVRIEDDVLVTPSGHEILTSLTRDQPILVE
jgi:Xaa-Pro aminopeptidase